MTLVVLQKKPPKHYKTGEDSKKLGPVLTYSLDQFLTYKTTNLGPVFNFTAYTGCFPNFEPNEFIKNSDVSLNFHLNPIAKSVSLI